MRISIGPLTVLLCTAFLSPGVSSDIHPLWSAPKLVARPQEKAWRSQIIGYTLWSEPRKFLFCVSQKVGCSEWLIYLHKQITGKEPARVYNRDSNETAGLHYLTSSPKDTEMLMRIGQDPSWHRFVVMRHPWDRLVSAYRNKVLEYCRENVGCVRQIFKLDIPANVTNLDFHTFVELVTATAPSRLEWHFLPQLYACNIGNIPFEVVHLESHEEMERASKLMGFETTIWESQGEHIRQRYFEGSGDHVIANHSQPCTPQTVRLVSQFYAADALLGGYTFDAAYESCGKYGLSQLAGQFASSSAGWGTTCDSISLSDFHNALQLDGYMDMEPPELPTASKLDAMGVFSLSARASSSTRHTEASSRTAGSPSGDHSVSSPEAERHTMAPAGGMQDVFPLWLSGLEDEGTAAMDMLLDGGHDDSDGGGAMDRAAGFSGIGPLKNQYVPYGPRVQPHQAVHLPASSMFAGASAATAASGWFSPIQQSQSVDDTAQYSMFSSAMSDGMTRDVPERVAAAAQWGASGVPQGAGPSSGQAVAHVCAPGSQYAAISPCALANKTLTLPSGRHSKSSAAAESTLTQAAARPASGRPSSSSTSPVLSDAPQIFPPFASPKSQWAVPSSSGPPLTLKAVCSRKLFGAGPKPASSYAAHYNPDRPIQPLQWSATEDTPSKFSPKVGDTPTPQAPVHLVRQYTCCQTPRGGLMRMLMATQLPSSEYRAAQVKPGHDNGLAIVEMALAAPHWSARQSEDGAAMGRPPPPPPKTLAWLPTQGMVRCYDVVEAIDALYVVSAAGDQMSMWKVADEAGPSVNTLQFQPVWAKKTQPQVRDMARRQYLLAWGGADGRLHCADLARQETASIEYLASEFFARSVYSPLGSLRWCPSNVSAMSLSFTLDGGSIQTRDLRSRKKTDRLQIMHFGKTAFYGHDWLDDYLLLAGGEKGALVLWDVRSPLAPLSGWRLPGRAAIGSIAQHGQITSGSYIFSADGESAGVYRVDTATGQVVCFLGSDEPKSASLSEQGYGVQEQWLPLGQPDDVWGWMQASTLGTASMYHNFSFEE